jgi:hypothetical protein
MTEKTLEQQLAEAKAAQDKAEKELEAEKAAHAKTSAALDKASPKEAEDEDLTPTPTQAEIDAAKLGLEPEKTGKYKTR